MYVETNGYNKEGPMLAIISIAIGIIFTAVWNIYTNILFHFNFSPFLQWDRKDIIDHITNVFPRSDFNVTNSPFSFKIK